MKGKLRIAAGPLLAVSLLFSGCTTFTSPARQHKVKSDAVWFDYDSTRRGALMLPASDKGKYVFCAEPAPDVALTLVNKMTGKGGNATGQTVEASAEFNATVAQLSGRTETVLLAREALYRLCEASVQYNFSPNKYMDEFDNVIDLIKQIASNEGKKSDEAKSRAEAVSSANKILLMKGADSQDAKKAFEALQRIR